MSADLSRIALGVAIGVVCTLALAGGLLLYGAAKIADRLRNLR